MTLINGTAPATASTVSGGQSAECQKAPPTNTKSKPDPQIIIGTLAELFPGVIVAERGQPRKPLKRGIHLDLVATGVVTPLEASIALRYFVSGRTYQLALAAGGARFDLDGKPCGEVSAEEAAGARLVLARMDEKQAKLTAEALVAFKAKREAQRAKARAEREDARAKDAAEFVAKRRAAGAVAEKPKSPAPCRPHRGDGLAGLKAAAQARRQMMGAR